MQTLLRTQKISSGSAEMRSHSSFRKAAKNQKVDRSETCFAGKTTLTMSQLREASRLRQMTNAL